jgi:hypothetical protein
MELNLRKQHQHHLNMQPLHMLQSTLFRRNQEGLLMLRSTLFRLKRRLAYDQITHQQQQ